MTTAIASYVERDCTFTHEGRTVESGGAVVTDKFIVAYLGKDGILTNWHGKQLGTYRILSSWNIRSYISNTMSSVECFVDGVRYVGRSAGLNMSIRAKRSPRQ